MGRAVAKFQRVAEKSLQPIRSQQLNHVTPTNQLEKRPETPKKPPKATPAHYSDPENVSSERIRVPVPQSLIEYVGLDGLSPGIVPGNFSREFVGLDGLSPGVREFKVDYFGESPHDFSGSIESDLGGFATRFDDVNSDYRVRESILYADDNMVGTRTRTSNNGHETSQNAQYWDVSSYSSDGTMTRSDSEQDLPLPVTVGHLHSKTRILLDDSLSDFEEYVVVQEGWSWLELLSSASNPYDIRGMQN